MATPHFFENETDRPQHSRAIQMLARDLRIPVEEIQILNERTLRSFKERARIKDYLTILVSRNVKDMIRGDIRTRTS